MPSTNPYSASPGSRPAPSQSLESLSSSSSHSRTEKQWAQQYYNHPNFSASSTDHLLPPAKGPAVRPAFARGPPTLRTVPSSSSLNDSPYSGTSAGRLANTIAPSISDKFSFSPDPASWGADISPSHPEADDYLHNPDPRRDRKNDRGGSIFTYRGCTNLGFLIFLGVGLVTLFAGYPLITFFTRHKPSTFGGFNLGGINATGQIPSPTGNWGMIDLDTPKEAHTIPSYRDGSPMQLVFSDEFNVPGRTFYPGDDPYWEAIDLHYWATGNLNWYDPAAVTTKNGALEITISEKQTHGLNYTSGFISTWNKFCFTGGIVEASVTLPGASDVSGLWPAIWTLGNLGRAGYGATLDGLWPYTYDACDVGTTPNQTRDGLPIAATVNGDKHRGGALSYLPGQRLSRCTCPGESHPGPIHQDGTYVGRAAPEIDVFEAQISSFTPGAPLSGQVSMSAQWAPFNAGYAWFNTSDNLIIPNPDMTVMNRYTGSALQQATSGVVVTNQNCYELGTGCFAKYGFEYKPGFDNGYISWTVDGQLAWTLNAAGVAADTRVEISSRPISQEPMYLIMNLAMSPSFQYVDLTHLTFPTTMRVDWIRVYQPANAIRIGCDPPDFPTAAYINEYIEAYTNPNITTWTGDFQQSWPKNKYLGQC